MRAVTCPAAAVALCLVLVAAPAHATICASDVVPAATLLVPYFEVALDQCGSPASQRLDTRFTIGNTTAHPVLAGVTIWSDWGVPVTGFQVYLPGESAQAVSLGAFLCDDVLPQTGSAVSPHPPGTDPPVSFPICNDTTVPGAAPYYAVPATDLSFLGSVRMALTGQFVPYYGGYFGQDWGDNVARGYLTVDALNQCHLEFPTSPIYYFIADGLGIASNENALVGEYAITDPANNFSYAQPAVRLEASTAFLPGDITFYGAYSGYSAADGREPLPSTFASPYIMGAAFDSSDQVIWRERTSFLPSPSPSYPLPLPLGRGEVWWFDETSDPFSSYTTPTFPGEPVLDLVSYPVVTHAYTPADVPYPVPFGWQYSNLQNPQNGNFAGQSWFVTRSQAVGRYETSRPAMPLDSSCVDSANVALAKTLTLAPTGGLSAGPPTDMMFWADFEDFLAGWSNVVGISP